MKGKNWIIGILVTVSMMVGGMWYYVQSNNFMQRAGEEISSLASQTLNTEVQIGAIEVNSLRDIQLHDLAVYDKQAELIARADSARVSFRLLAAVSDPADAVQEITVRGVSAVLAQRTDGTWNVEDLVGQEKSSQQFHGKIMVEDAQVLLRSQGQELQFNDLAATVDCADYPVYKAEFAGRQQGTEVSGTATISDTRQIVNARVNGLDVKEYLRFIPAGLIPDNVEIQDGLLESADIHLYRRDGDLSFSGEADFSDGKVKVEGTEIEQIAGHAAFTNEEAPIWTCRQVPIPLTLR